MMKRNVCEIRVPFCHRTRCVRWRTSRDTTASDSQLVVSLICLTPSFTCSREFFLLLASHVVSVCLCDATTSSLLPLIITVSPAAAAV